MNRLILAVLIIGVTWSCCNLKDSQENVHNKAAGNEGAIVQKRSQSPAVFKQNVSVIEGRIDSVIVIDDSNFRIMIMIFSSTQEEDIDSFADAGQQVICTPEYFVGDVGIIDLNNSRNSKLISLRLAKHGDRIRAKLSMDRKGEWKIIEVIE